MRPLRHALLFILAAGMAAPLPAQAPVADALRPGAEKILATDADGAHAYQALEELSDDIGARLSGSPQLDQAIAWAKARMEADGFENVHLEKAMVPHWVRGEEACELVAPRPVKLSMIGLGMSVATPKGGITADVVVVKDFAELDQMGDKVKGRIVLFDEVYQGYGKSVPYRMAGASRAANYGAVACLIRSVESASLNTPHTGTLIYDAKEPKIPAAALSLEHAAFLHRLYDRGKRVRVHLEMGAKQLADAPSANVVGELRGSGKPEEIVLVGGHIDSWDVGQGSQDDGVGCILSMESVRLIKAAGLRPRRTLRVVLFTNEENGARGAKAYAEQHAAEAGNHVAVLESDSGNGRIGSFTLDLEGEGMNQSKAKPDAAGEARALAFANQIAPLLAPLGADRMKMGGSGVDVGPMVGLGALGFGAGHDGTHYFDVHHSQADSFDKIVQADLAHNAHAMAILLYALADMDQRPGR